MTNTIARIKQAGKHFEVVVDLENALKFKKGEISSIQAESENIFTNTKRGEVASNSDLEECFKTTNIQTIVEKIIKNGEVLVNQEHRDEESEKKLNQLVEFLVKNTTNPQTGNPNTAERIKSALDQIQINLKNTPIEDQIKDILSKLNSIIPIKLETKKIKIIVSPADTGKILGIINPYKEKENWLDDGSLEVFVNVPSGVLIDFYDKLNSLTHGSALTEEVKEEWQKEK